MDNSARSYETGKKNRNCTAYLHLSKKVYHDDPRFHGRQKPSLYSQPNHFLCLRKDYYNVSTEQLSTIERTQDLTKDDPAS